MRWYEHLYVGKKAKKKRHRIIGNIRSSRLFPGSYVITPASNGNNLLDIYPSAMLSVAYYKDSDLLILGIASDYFEALEVACMIVDELYQKTGGFDLAGYLDRKTNRM